MGSTPASITLPSNTLWVTEELGVFVVEGEPVAQGLAMLAFKESFRAPAAWAQYDKPCANECDEQGLYQRRWPDGGYTVWPCELPDCRDGHQVWEVRWHYGDDGWCSDPAHTVSARAIIQVGPVVALDDLAFTLTYPCVTVNVRADQPDALLELTADEFHDVSSLLDPLPVAGRDFALVVKVTS